MLCFFLLYNNVNHLFVVVQSQLCLTLFDPMDCSNIYVYIPSVLSLPGSSPSHPSRSSQSTKLSSLCYTAASH